jgi:hypothetical protein
LGEEQGKTGGAAGAREMELSHLFAVVKERVARVYGQPNPLDDNTLTILTSLEVLELIDLIRRLGFGLDVRLPPETLRTMGEHLDALSLVAGLRERSEHARPLLAELADSGAPAA